MERFELVIAGGGLTAARAVGAYRDAGGAGRVALVAGEPVLPYHRPPLSKRYLRGETTDTPYVEDESFYRDRDVELVLDTQVDGVDLHDRTVAAGPRSLGYEQLLIATGARPRPLEAPGANLEGVFTLRTVHNSAAIRAAAQAAGQAVVVGAGFIGMEVAASLRGLGLAVTLIHRGRGLFDQLGSPQLSEQLHALYRDNGVELRFEEEVASFVGDGTLAAVETRSGGRVEADLAVVGVGVAPNVDFLAGTAIEVDNGVVVDERFATGVQGVYAAGDVARFMDPLYGRRRRIEHWSNANYQGGRVGQVLAGADAPYDTVSSFFSEVFGLTIRVFGDTSHFDSVTADGSLAAGRFLAAYGDRGRLVAVLGVGLEDEVQERVKGLIAERASIDALPDPSVLATGGWPA
jgi:3-phenylpropionate/trans-cinnamate dioxygenase ferredoxin reductase subunit